jgi:hypothetical protein
MVRAQNDEDAGMQHGKPLCGGIAKRAALAAIVASTVAAICLAAVGLSAQAEAGNGDLQARIARYHKELAAYEKARAAHERVSAPYWRLITRKRTERRRKLARHQRVTLDDYVLEQPPLYNGPREPVDPQAASKPRPIPVEDDFLRNAQKHFGFTPQRPRNEVEYKRAYARAATDAGLRKNTCVKIYGFESGGNGTYDIQAGREYDRNARVISTALGYNQLLTTNSVELVAEQGDKLMAALRSNAAKATGQRKAQLEEKIRIFDKMVRFSRTVPDDWNAHARLANTERGIGMHALILDIDIGPMLQTEKLLTSVVFARRKGYDAPLTAAELEMMNLTGDGNGYDMVQMPQTMREKVPTSNFFLQRGYERNPVAIRNNTVAKLLAATDAKMMKEAQLAGARELAGAFDAVTGGGQKPVR